MCGISGYFLKQSFESNSESILNMLYLQKHRGPDDSGVLGINMAHGSLEEVNAVEPSIFTNKPNLIFGFNRLSIMDLSPAGYQPMIDIESKVALMMNGEIYNAFDYRPELIQKGYFFKGGSDTEVVLYLYLEFGLDGLLERLNGMFALTIYDGRHQEFYLVRDRVGIKPLYVLHETNRIAFSSELKSFKALSNFKFELDETKLSEFLLFRNVINKTLFKNVVNLEPGSYWVINSSNDVQIKTYYNLRNEGRGDLIKSKLALEQSLKNSVRRQMISDVKLGCQLSGGVDSSLVTAFAAETLSEGSLETVSIVFDEKNFSEKEFIDKVSEQFKLISHQFTLDSSMYFDLLDEAIWHFEHPLNHPNTIGIKLLSREAKKHVTVLLSGEGADEALAGYGRFSPSILNFFSLETFRKVLKNKRHFFEFIKVWKQKENRFLLQTAFTSFDCAFSIYSKFSVEKALESRKNIWNSIHDHFLKRKRKYELLTYLPDLLMRQDKMSMAHTIENRVPFLDNEILETALCIPDEKLVKKLSGKWEGKFLLKEICSDIFGKSFSYRNKMGFGVPLKSFLTSNIFIERWNNEILPGIQKRGIFNHEQLAYWMNNSKKMNPEQLDVVWLMVGFEVWAKQYLD